MKYINLAFFILAIAFLSVFTYLDLVIDWNLSGSSEERELIELANAINNDFKSAVSGDAISFEPDLSSYATTDVNLSHSKIVATKGKLFRENTDGNYEEVTTLIPKKWDNKLTDFSSSVDTRGERRGHFFFVAIFMIVVLSLVIFANFMVALLHHRKVEKQPIPAPPLHHQKYFYLLNDQQLGPVAKKELEELLSSNKISSTTLVWCEGMNDWEELSKVF